MAQMMPHDAARVVWPLYSSTAHVILVVGLSYAANTENSEYQGGGEGEKFSGSVRIIIQ
jgi:membrane protein involved in colicin uptake